MMTLMDVASQSAEEGVRRAALQGGRGKGGWEGGREGGREGGKEYY